MNIITTPLSGAAVIDLERKEDDRGFFARTFDRKEFADAGLEPLVEQCNLSFNYLAGTLRGMHYQVAPATEAKLVRCTAGAIVDIVVDVRPDSAHYWKTLENVDLATFKRVLADQSTWAAERHWEMPEGVAITLWKKKATRP